MRNLNPFWLPVIGLLGGVLVAATFGQPPTVQGPAGTYTSSVTLSAPGMPNLPTPMTGPAGTYTFTATVPVVITKTDSSYTISWTAPVPPVPPTPVPPGPVTGQLYTFAVFDAKSTASPTADQLAIQKSTTISDAMKSLNSLWAVADVANPAFSQWVSEAKKVGIPALVVLSVDSKNTGTLVAGYPIPLPKDEASVIAEIKKIRGK